MKLHSLDNVTTQIEDNKAEMMAKSQEIARGENVAEAADSIKELNEANIALEELASELDTNDGNPSVTIDEELNLSEVIGVEATVANVANVVDRVLSSVVDYLESGISDEDKKAVASQLTKTDSLNTLHLEVTNALKSGRGTKMPADEVVRIREAFHADWVANNSVKYPDFITRNGITMKYYSLVNLVKGETYPEVGGPVRGRDFDVPVVAEDTETVEVAA